MRRIAAEVAGIGLVLTLWFLGRPETTGTAVAVSLVILVSVAFNNRHVEWPAAAPTGEELDQETRPTPRGVHHFGAAAAGFVTTVGFSVAGMNQTWLLIVLGFSVAVYAMAMVTIRGAFYNRPAVHYGHAATAVAVAAWLYLVGSAFQIRIDLDPNPVALGGLWLDTDPTAPVGVRAQELFSETWRLVAVPGLILVGMMVGRAVAAVRRMLPGQRRENGPWRPWATQALFCVSLLVMSALYLAPLGDAPVNGAHLTIFGFATPELAKVWWLGLAAFVMIYPPWHNAIRLRPKSAVPSADKTTTWWGRGGRLPMTARNTWLALLVLFGLGQAALRSDVGSTVALLGAAAAVYAATAHRYRYYLYQNQPDGLKDGKSGSRRRFARGDGELNGWWVSNRSLRTISILAVAVAAAMVTLVMVSGYQAERLRVVKDPFAYETPAPCTRISDPDLGLTPEQQRQIIDDTGQRLVRAANATDTVIPEDFAATWQSQLNSQICVTTRADRQREQYAQVGLGLAIMNGGGLWGLGMDDTSARRVPAVKTDFAMNAFVSKFGMVAGAAVTLGTVLLGFLLMRIPRHGFQGLGMRSMPYAFAAGSAGALFFTVLFVWLAITAIMPHSGVPFPFLSVGAHSNVAWILALCSVLVLARMTAVKMEPGTVPTTTRQLAAVSAGDHGSRASLWWVMVAALSILPIVLAQVVPRTGLTSATQKLHAPVLDQRVRVLLATGEIASPAASDEDLDNPQLNPMAAYLSGLVRETTNDPSSVYDYVAQSGTLTKQEWVATDQGQALRSTINGDYQENLVKSVLGLDAQTPIPQAAMVLDAHTGEVLAAASVPQVPESNLSVDDIARLRKYVNAERDYWSAAAAAVSSAVPGAERGPMRWGPGDNPDGPLASKSTRYCSSNTEWECWRVQVEPGAPVKGDLRYVDGRTDVPAPDPEVFRPLAEFYGPGSTFKLVTTIAHLRAGGSVQDMLPGPATLTLEGGRVVRNYDEVPCGANDQVTVADALAMSCNTAFVALGQQLGWGQIRDTALLLGFEITPEDEVTTYHDDYLHGVSPVPQVPETAEGEYIVNAVLGGGRVRATPVSMARVAALALNAGQQVAPKVTQNAVAEADGQEVLTPEQAEQLWQAMKLAHSHGRGTLRSVTVPPGVEFGGKSGTHVLGSSVEGEEPTGYWTHDLWIVGTARAGDQDVVVVSVVTTSDATAGRARNVQTVETVLNHLQVTAADPNDVAVDEAAAQEAVEAAEETEQNGGGAAPAPASNAPGDDEADADATETESGAGSSDETEEPEETENPDDPNPQPGGSDDIAVVDPDQSSPTDQETEAQ